MRQKIIFLFLAFFIFLLPGRATAQKVELDFKSYYNFPGIGVAMDNHDFKPAFMMAGWHMTMLKKGKLNFLGFGVSYNWVHNSNVPRNNNWDESIAFTVPLSLQIGKGKNDDTVYLTVSYAYNTNDSVRGHSLLTGFSIGSQ